MLSFTIIRSTKSDRIYVYDQHSIQLAQFSSLSEVFNYFYTWVEKLNSESVTFTRTTDKYVILAKIV